jgi:hypothetical protein
VSVSSKFRYSENPGSPDGMSVGDPEKEKPKIDAARGKSTLSGRKLQNSAVQRQALPSDSGWKPGSPKRIY